jgi:thioredoxin 1
MLSRAKGRRNDVAKILDVTDATFEQEVLKSDRPVLIDFWAEWCAPCRQLAPTIKELAEEYGDKLRVVKIDVDANPKTASQMQVRAMPTLLMVKNGAVVGQLVGRQPKDKLKQMIAPTL